MQNTVPTFKVKAEPKVLHCPSQMSVDYGAEGYLLHIQ